MFNHVAAAAASHLCRCLHGSCFLELSEIVHYLVVLVLLPKILVPPGSFPMFNFEILQRMCYSYYAHIWIAFLFDYSVVQVCIFTNLFFSWTAFMVRQSEIVCWQFVMYSIITSV
jgi:hypothetical protein